MHVTRVGIRCPCALFPGTGKVHTFFTYAHPSIHPFIVTSSIYILRRERYIEKKGEAPDPPSRNTLFELPQNKPDVDNLRPGLETRRCGYYQRHRSFAAPPPSYRERPLLSWGGALLLHKCTGVANHMIPPSAAKPSGEANVSKSQTPVPS